MTTTVRSPERTVNELMALYHVQTPPVPLEAILQQPQPGMWTRIDLSVVAGPMLEAHDIYSTRLALAQLLAHLICTSPWGSQRSLNVLAQDETALHQLTRILLMPRDLLYTLPTSTLRPAAMRALFEVPQVEARRRLVEVGVISD